MSIQESKQPSGNEQGAHRGRAVDTLRRYSLLLTVILLFAVFASIQPRFYSMANVINILREASIQGILAVGLTMVVVSGEIDLSFGANASLAAVCSLLFVRAGVNLLVAWPLILLFSVLVGVLNAFVVVRLKIPALLGTIGTWLALGGLVAWISRGATIWTSRYPAIFEIPGRGRVFGVIPVPIITLLVVAFIGLILLEYTKMGRYFYAVGGNPDAATHAGISTSKVKTQAFIILGFLCGVGGITMGSMFASTTPTIGQQFFFPAIISVFLGSIFLKDGVPNLWGTVLASLFLAIISNGFNLIGLMYWHEQIAQGLLMLFSVSMITVISKKEVKGVSL